MNKIYYVSDRINGVIFRNRKSLEEYYKNATKIEGMSCGKIITFDNESDLTNYIVKNNTHPRNAWKTA